MNEAFRCVGLTKRLGRRAVVDGLDLTVARGEVVGFVGPNGAGKTTTIRMILGLARPSSGLVRVLGCEPGSRELAGRIGALVEEPEFYPWMTGTQNLRVLSDSGPPVSEVQIREALVQADIDDAADTKVKAYSQGMRQRLGLAAALMRRPDLLVLDEPANGLDPAGIRELRLVLRKEAERGAAVFLSSHQLVEVEAICDRVAVLDRGRLVGEGSPDALGVGRRRTRVIVLPSEMADARKALGRFGVDVVAPDTLLVDSASGRDVTTALLEGGVVPESVSAVQPTFEERVLSVVKDTRAT